MFAEVEIYMVGEIFQEHFYEMADITFKLSPWLEKFSILVVSNMPKITFKLSINLWYLSNISVATVESVVDLIQDSFLGQLIWFGGWHMKIISCGTFKERLYFLRATLTRSDRLWHSGTKVCSNHLGPECRNCDNSVVLKGI